jgi:CRP-like cAMP-binding protein
VTVQIRDRILELRRVPAAELQANPANWRRHSAPNPTSDQGEHVATQGRHGAAPRPPEGEIVSPSPGADLQRTVLALAANAEEYWTTQEIADFVGRSRRQVYRILAERRRSGGRASRHIETAPR